MHLHAAILTDRHCYLLQSFVSTVKTEHSVHVARRPEIKISEVSIKLSTVQDLFAAAVSDFKLSLKLTSLFIKWSFITTKLKQLTNSLCRD